MFNLFKKNNQNKSSKVSAIVVAAGQSTRMGYLGNKQFIEIFDKPVIAYALESLQNAPSVEEIIIVTGENDILAISDIVREFGIAKATNVVPGGDTRGQSVQNGLKEALDADIVLIHDGARPCIKTEDIETTIEAARTYGAAALAIPATDTLKLVGDDMIIKNTLDRSNIWYMQTPQVFKLDIIQNAYKLANDNGITATDDCALVESLGVSVHIVKGTSSNIKITTKDDVIIARAILENSEE